jgi:hypothetical protein
MGFKEAPDMLLDSQEMSIIEVLRRTPGGMNINVILAELKNTLSKRTLQRRLQNLIAKNKIRKEGRGPITVYILVVKDLEQPYDNIILSEDSREIVTYVNQDLTARTPVAFSRDFIDAYQPAKTWYLNQLTRNHLRNIGTTGFDNRPAGTYGRAILDRLLIDLSWASSRLEGNTYTLLDTKRLIEMGQIAEGRDAMETQMILNHKQAIEMLIDDASQIGFDRYTFLNLHGTLSENLMNDPSSSGTLRKRAVEISHSAYQPNNLPQLIEDVFEILLQKVKEIPDPFEQAFFILVHIPYLQPFEDVNKRVARLGANIPLIQQNLCPLTFLDVPLEVYVEAMLGIYEMNRIELLRDVFVWAYERSTQKYLQVKQSISEPDPLRLKYRNHTHNLLARVVRELRIPAKPAVQAYAKQEIPKKDRDIFIDMVMEDLKRLHEGILARYRIRLSEFRKWKAAQSTLAK